MNGLGNENIRVICVDDDPDFCFLIKSLLEREQDLNLVGSATNREDAVDMAQKLHPHIVLLDLNLTPGEDLGGIEEQLRKYAWLHRRKSFC